MNGLLVSGQTAGENCQIEIGFEPELKKLQTSLSLSVQHDQTQHDQTFP